MAFSGLLGNLVLRIESKHDDTFSFRFVYLLVFRSFFFFLETGSNYVVLAVLELTMLTRLASNSESKFWD